MQNLRTIILAAGKGTRMRSDVPKVLHEICGKPIIQYVFDVVKSVGSLKNYVVLGYKAKEVEKRLPSGIFAVEQKKLLGTADAVRSVEKYLKNYRGDVLILCGDTPLLNKNVIRAIIRKQRKVNAVCTFLTAVVHEPEGYGRIIRDDEGKVISIREDKDAAGLEREIVEINVGVYCFKSKELFEELRLIKLNAKKKEFYLTDIIERFVEKKYKVETVETEDPKEGLGINNKEDLAAAESIIQKNILKDFMLRGVTIVDPGTTYIDSGVKIGRDTVIRPFTFIEGNVRIGNNCKIGPFSRLRTGVKIGNNTVIGNFTEVSRTRIGKRSMMKHFSYLGDSFVGDNVNIGAGTITANYDGKQKNKTVIENGAFIGCDTVLIAPVKIGKGSVVGAGSVIPKKKNIPAGSLALGIPAKIISRRKSK